MFCFWHCFSLFVLFSISTVCGLFHSEQTSWHWHYFLSFVFFPISTVCELFFSEEVSCFRLWDIFISAEVLVLAFWSDLSNLLLNMFCFWHCFLSFVLFLISTVCELFFSEKKYLVSHFEIVLFLLKYWY